MSAENCKRREGGLTRRGFMQVAGIAGAAASLSAAVARAGARSAISQWTCPTTG